MNDKIEQRLNTLLLKRSKVMEKEINFNDNFDNFFNNLHEVIKNLNNVLEQRTREGLRLFRENPYQRNTSRFFAMVQLFMLNDRNAYNLNNSETFPLIKFEGDEITCNVKSTIIYRNVVNKTNEYAIKDLLDKDKVSEVILNFLDTIYSLNDK